MRSRLSERLKKEVLTKSQSRRAVGLVYDRRLKRLRVQVDAKSLCASALDHAVDVGLTRVLLLRIEVDADELDVAELLNALKLQYPIVGFAICGVLEIDHSIRNPAMTLLVTPRIVDESLL